jgi:predicted Zn-dependent protease
VGTEQDPSSTFKDASSAIVHEFGHVMGMDHRTDGSTGPCVMATYLSAGQIKRAFCADEKGLMQGFYGFR